jgi:hypothetical protein
MPPTAKQIEDAAAQVQRHVLQAANHAAAGDYRRAHAEAEAAQGAARKLKELLGGAGVHPSRTLAADPPAQPSHAHRSDDHGYGAA